MDEMTRQCPRGGQVAWNDKFRTGVSRVFHVEGVDYAELLAFHPDGDEWLLLRMGDPMDVAGGMLTLVAVEEGQGEPEVRLRFIEAKAIDSPQPRHDGGS